MKTCHVVDDSSVIRKVARRIFEDCHFRITEAENGRDAIDMCREGLPDAILLDACMPVMDGFEFLRELRAMPQGGEPVVLFCTIENDVAQIARALRAGANDYIMKPFDREAVTSKLHGIGLM